MAWSVRLLGDTAVTCDGVAVDALSNPRVTRLVARLALAGSNRLDRARLAFELWPDSTEQQARTNLRKLLHEVRRAAGDRNPLVRVDRAAVALAPGVDVDVVAVREAIARHDAPAVARRYGGDLLPSCYDDWALAERDRLRASVCRALEQAATDAGDPGERLSLATVVLAHDPLSEAAHRLAMQAHAQLGDRAGAARAYRRCVEALDRELGVAPSPETERVHAAVAAGAAGDLDPRAAAGTPTNLPWVDPLVGRRADVAAVAGLVRAHRLVTVTGPGGVGKSRLALAAARSLAGDWTDGCWWVELAPLRDGAGVVGVVAGTVPTMSMPTTPGELVAQLRDRQLLVVLDNCEHLVEPVAGLVAALLAGCPGLRVLCTSQEALALDREHVWPLAPLTEEDAAALFAARARAVRPDVALDGEEVGTICRRLDGLPLAVELAAARVATMAVSDIAAQLDDRFALLDGGLRGQRHRGLAAMVAWGYAQLDDPTRGVFAALGVFPGSFTRDAAVAVAGGDDRAGGDDGAGGDVGAHLDLLVRRSLVVADVTVSPTRYRLLETLRLFALDRLAGLGTVDAARRRHADFYADWAGGLTGVTSPDEAQWLARGVDEFDNLRAAVALAVERADTDLAVRLVARLWPLSVLWRSELLDWAQRVLALPGADRHPDAAGAYLLVASLAWITGDIDTSERAAEEALRRPLDEDAWTRAACIKSSMLAYRGRLEHEDRLWAHRRRAGAPVNRVWFDSFLVAGEAYRGRPSGVDPARLLADADAVAIPGIRSFARTAVALSLIPQGRAAEAIRLVHEALELAQPGLNRFAVNIAHEIAALAATDADGVPDQARRALALADDYPLGLGFALIGLVVTADRHHRHDVAALLAGYISAHLRELALPRRSAEVMAGRPLPQFVTPTTAGHFDRGRTMSPGALLAELERLAGDPTAPAGSGRPDAGAVDQPAVTGR